MALHINTHWMKAGLSGLGAVMAVGVATQLVKPPPLTPVAVLTRSVPALAPVTRQDITWVRMEHPPTGTVTAWAGDPLAASALTAGTVLTQADFSSAAQAVGLKSGDVRYVVGITPASAVVSVGQRVDLWSVASAGTQNGTAPQELASGVRVIGLFTSSGAPIGASSASSGGLLGGTSSGASTVPALAALAVPECAMSTLMAADPSQTVLLVQDPSQTTFGLITGGSTATTPSSRTIATAPATATPTESPPHAAGSHTTQHTTKKTKP
jgi:hypothetical protein